MARGGIEVQNVPQSCHAAVEGTSAFTKLSLRDLWENLKGSLDSKKIT